MGREVGEDGKTGEQTPFPLKSATHTRHPNVQSAPRGCNLSRLNIICSFTCIARPGPWPRSTESQLSLTGGKKIIALLATNWFIIECRLQESKLYFMTI